MKKNLFVMFALIALVFISCQKTEVYSDELTTSVIFRPVLEENLTINKSIPLNRTALGGLADIAVDELVVSAVHISGKNPVSEIFKVTEGASNTEIRLENVALGENIFNAYTTSYSETPETDPYSNEMDGFSSFNQPYPIDNPDKSVESTVNNLRAINPYVEFIGDAVINVIYNNCETNCNEIDINMVAQQGRWIATVEFANSELAEHYEAIVKVSHYANNMGDAPFRIVSILDGNPFAWFYMTHADCNNDLFIEMKIELKDKSSGKIVNDWILDTKSYSDKIAVENGIDRWVQIIIGENSLTSGCVDFKFTWDWAMENEDITL